MFAPSELGCLDRAQKKEKEKNNDNTCFQFFHFQT